MQNNIQIMRYQNEPDYMGLPGWLGGWLAGSKRGQNKPLRRLAAGWLAGWLADWLAGLAGWHQWGFLGAWPEKCQYYYMGLAVRPLLSIICGPTHCPKQLQW